MSEHGQGHVSRLCTTALRGGCPYPRGEVPAALRVPGSLAIGADAHGRAVMLQK